MKRPSSKAGERSRRVETDLKWPRQEKAQRRLIETGFGEGGPEFIGENRRRNRRCESVIASVGGAKNFLIRQS